MNIPSGYIRFTPKTEPTQSWEEWAEDSTFDGIDLLLSTDGSGSTGTLKKVIQNVANSGDENNRGVYFERHNKYYSFYCNLMHDGEYITIDDLIVPNYVYYIEI